MGKRINLIVGKKQIIIAGLTVVLGAAVYVNYIFTDTDKSALVSGDAPAANYGDSELVNSNIGGISKPTAKSVKFDAADAAVTTPAVKDAAADYFANARLSKQESRDEAKEFLRSMLSGGDVTGTEIAVISQDAAGLSSRIESENKIETTLKAQGFDEILCYLSGGPSNQTTANVIVKTAGLKPEDAAKIKSALLSEVDIAAEAITIVEVK